LFRRFVARVSGTIGTQAGTLVHVVTSGDTVNEAQSTIEVETP
jgi:hypothetical protein